MLDDDTGDGAGLDLRLKRGASIQGRIVGLQGASVAGVMVSVLAFRMGAHPI